MRLYLFVAVLAFASARVLDDDDHAVYFKRDVPNEQTQALLTELISQARSHAIHIDDPVMQDQVSRAIITAASYPELRRESSLRLSLLLIDNGQAALAEIAARIVEIGDLTAMKQLLYVIKTAGRELGARSLGEDNDEWA